MKSMTSDEDARDYRALQELYKEWARGEPSRFAVVAAGALQGVYDAQATARGVLLTLPEEVARVFVVPLWPLDGWRHPRFVVESYRRPGSPLPLAPQSDDPLMRDFLVAEELRRDQERSGAPDGYPYVLIKAGALLGRYKRVTQARQRIDAAMPPLAPTVFTSLRPARVGSFDLMVLQALVDALPT
jgi:hypothetical protein